MNPTPANQRPLERVVIAAPLSVACDKLAAQLSDAGFVSTLAHSAGDVFEAIHVNTPACIVVPYAEAPGPATRLVREMKSDHAYGHLPLVLVITPELAACLDWNELHADDFLYAGETTDGIRARLQLCIERAARDLDANPLTGLPGNLTIMRAAERRIASGIPFSMGYVDLDNFKPYNDKYGFARGDEVLRMTARLVVNAVRELGSLDTYVGHIGGDDFIYLAPCELAEAAAAGITKRFDLVVPSFYDEEDRRNKYIESIDRQGQTRVFPLMGCSIALVDTAASAIRHVGELSARAAEVKKAAKAVEGSSYMIDRRR